MRTIWKFPIADAGGLPMDRFVLDMPADARCLAVQMQDFRPWVWALVAPDARKETRAFITAGTGYPLPDEGIEYVGTYQMGPGVFHLFEVGS